MSSYFPVNLFPHLISPNNNFFILTEFGSDSKKSGQFSDTWSKNKLKNVLV